MSLDQLYWLISLSMSVLLPLLAWRVRRIRWKIKLPLCLLLANILPIGAVAPLTSAEDGVGFSITMMLGLFVSALIVVLLSSILLDQTPR